MKKEDSNVDRVISSQGIRIIKKEKLVVPEVRYPDVVKLSRNLPLDNPFASPLKSKVETPTPNSKSSSKLYKKAALVATSLLILSGFLFWQFSNKRNIDTPPLTSEEVLDAVAKLMSVPVDEVPNIATIDDVSKVKDQPFYKEAEVGDRVIIYPESRLIILYRPRTDTIVEFSAF